MDCTKFFLDVPTHPTAESSCGMGGASSWVLSPGWANLHGSHVDIPIQNPGCVNFGIFSNGLLETMGPCYNGRTWHPLYKTTNLGELITAYVEVSGFSRSTLVEKGEQFLSQKRKTEAHVIYEENGQKNMIILLMDKILHHQGWWISHYL